MPSLKCYGHCHLFVKPLKACTAPSFLTNKAEKAIKLMCFLLLRSAVSPMLPPLECWLFAGSGRLTFVFAFRALQFQPALCFWFGRLLLAVGHGSVAWAMRPFAAPLCL